MPYDSHQRAAEFHELAAHAHRVAMAHLDKEDHLTAHELTKQAMEHRGVFVKEKAATKAAGRVTPAAVELSAAAFAVSFVFAQFAGRPEGLSAFVTSHLFGHCNTS